MKIIADLHLHSKYSRATSPHMEIPAMAAWGRTKGIGLLGTGDFTHPRWRIHLREFLEPAEAGLFRLSEAGLQAAREAGAPVPAGVCAEEGFPLFCLTVEISSIYSKNGRLRKIHNLVFADSLEKVERFCRALEEYGSLSADGRPILGLDCEVLAEILRETIPEGFLIPAHAWTPHFSVFGSQSGFDSLEECFGKHAAFVRAIETGLSSDPGMNRRISALDPIALVSFSDAHSPENLGREACILDLPEPSFAALRCALEGGKGLTETIEFFPEEGKYHYDGHRGCGVRRHPAETIRAGKECPKCGRPLTLGVLHRVESLADRPEGKEPPGGRPYRRMIPLAEVIADVRGIAKTSQAVRREYTALVEALGPEFIILLESGRDEVAQAATEEIADGLEAMRRGDLEILPGYDGEYGKISLRLPAKSGARQGELFG